MGGPLSEQDVTTLLQGWRNGDAEAHERLLPVVYDELRRVARARLRGEAANHTLQPTALVHEAYLRLIGPNHPSPLNRMHLFALAARAMRQVLVDHARRKKASKRGGPALAVTLLDSTPAREAPIVDLIDLDDALADLAALDSRLCRVVELKYFAGLSIDEMAATLMISAATVERDWAMAKAWLYTRLNSSPPP